MREKIAKSVIDFKGRRISEEKDLEQKIKKMRERIQLLGKKRVLENQAPKIIEYGEITPVERNL